MMANIMEGDNLSTMESKVFVIFKGDDYDQDDPYCNNLKSIAGCVHKIPVLSFNFINGDKLADRLANEPSYCGLVLTSPRSVEAVSKICPKGDGNQDDHGDGSNLIDILSKKLIFPVGPKTQEAVKDRLGLNDSVGGEIGKVGSSELLASFIVERFKDQIKAKGSPLFMHCSSIAKDTIHKVLSENGIPVELLSTYETCSSLNLVRDIRDLMANYQDKDYYFVFFSPSGVKAVKNVLDSHDIGHQDLKYIAIGKTTSQALVDYGLTVFAVADNPDPLSLVEAIKKAMGY